MIEKIIGFWDNYGWLANLMTIVLGIGTIIGAIYGLYQFIKRIMKSRKDYSNIYNYIQDKPTGKTIKNRKIAIIDDQPENYPLEYLRKAGFNITVYEKVSLSNYSFVSDYDLIFLDITNVVEEDLERGGFELIKRIRDELIDVVIVGMSSKRFDPTLTEFFKMADDQSKTPISEKDCEKLITDTLEKHYSAKKIATNIDDLISKSRVTHKQHKKLVGFLTSYLDGEISGDKFNRSVSQYAYCVDTNKLYEKSKKLKEVA
ncbi:hypothetical protein ACWJJH_09435 [Endozoicomonadaceae bacterium StTr2]